MVWLRTEIFARTGGTSFVSAHTIEHVNFMTKFEV